VPTSKGAGRKGARLKVFVTSDGLTDYVVATGSRPKALDAWGVRQDLFKEGQARETDDPALTEAALARPGEVLRRPTGVGGKLARLKAPAKSKPTGPDKDALRKIAKLEKKLAELEATHGRALADLDAQISRLQARREKLAQTQARALDELRARLRTARDAPG